MQQLKKLLYLLILLLLCTIPLTAEETPARIFTVNLFSEDIDLKLMYQDTLAYEASDIAPFTIAPLSPSQETGSYALVFKYSESEEWFGWSDEEDNLIGCSIEAGNVYTVIIDIQGEIHFYQLQEESTDRPKISFMNSTADTLALMAIGESWEEEGIRAYAEDIEHNQISNFRDVSEGSYKLYWQFESQKPLKKYFFYPEEKSGEPKEFEFQKEHHYLFLAYTFGRQDYALLFDLDESEPSSSQTPESEDNG